MLDQTHSRCQIHLTATSNWTKLDQPKEAEMGIDVVNTQKEEMKLIMNKWENVLAPHKKSDGVNHVIMGVSSIFEDDEMMRVTKYLNNYSTMIKQGINNADKKIKELQVRYEKLSMKTAEELSEETKEIISKLKQEEGKIAAEVKKAMADVTWAQIIMEEFGVEELINAPMQEEFSSASKKQES
jgi:hypothetical protein